MYMRKLLLLFIAIFASREASSISLLQDSIVLQSEMYEHAKVFIEKYDSEVPAKRRPVLLIQQKTDRHFVFRLISIITLADYVCDNRNALFINAGAMNDRKIVVWIKSRQRSKVIDNFLVCHQTLYPIYSIFKELSIIQHDSEQLDRYLEGMRIESNIPIMTLRYHRNGKVKSCNYEDKSSHYPFIKEWEKQTGGELQIL